MNYKIEKKIFSWVPKIKLASKSYIVAHDAGNPNNVGSDSLAKEILFMNNTKGVFVSHWVGGGGRIVQVAPTGLLQYGCGPNGNPHAYAQVELARTNNKETFKKDYAAYVWLLRKLANEAGIPIRLDGTGKGIKTHRWIKNNVGGTTHSDPYDYLASMGISATQFKKDIENGLESKVTIASRSKNEVSSYYKSGSGIFRIKQDCYAYKSVKFDKKNRVELCKKNTEYTIVGIVKYGSTYRLKTRWGLYITANKEFVEKVLK